MLFRYLAVKRRKGANKLLFDRIVCRALCLKHGLAADEKQSWRATHPESELLALSVGEGIRIDGVGRENALPPGAEYGQACFARNAWASSSEMLRINGHHSKPETNPDVVPSPGDEAGESKSDPI